MNAVPDSVCSNWLSRSSLSCWTCGANSEPYVAVAIRQPPPSGIGTGPELEIQLSVMYTSPKLASV